MVGEVKNMAWPRDPSDLELESMADRVEVLEALLTGKARLEEGRRLFSKDDGAVLVGSLISVYNGGRLSGGGRVSSSFSAEPRVLAPDYKKPVYFVVVAADEAAAVFIYRVPLQQLKDVKFLRSVAEEVFIAFMR